MAPVHLDPEVPWIELREVGLDQERAGLDADLPQRAAEMMMIGDVELALGTKHRGHRMIGKIAATLMMPELPEMPGLVLYLDHTHANLRRA